MRNERGDRSAPKPDGTRQPMITGESPSLRAVRNDALLLSCLLPNHFPGRLWTSAVQRLADRVALKSDEGRR
jgi:hypothetical protein